MRSIGCAAICAAMAFAGVAKADTFTLTNTRHDDCHNEFPGILPNFDCNTLAGNGVGSATINGGNLTGADLNQQGPVDPNTATLTAIAAVDQTLTYSWDYFSEDTISSAFDPAGFLLNGAKTQLTDGSGNFCADPNADVCLVVFKHQTGEVTFDLTAGESYGFYVFSTDSAEGAGHISWTLESSNIGSAAPEPATWAAMLLGFFGVGAIARRRPAFNAG